MCDAKLSLCVKSKVCSSPGLLAAFQGVLLGTLSRQALMTQPQFINPKERGEDPYKLKAEMQTLAILLIKRSESFPQKSPIFGVTYIHISGCN